MTLVVLGVDALDPELVDESTHPDLTLSSHRSIETIVSSTGEPSTHELWPTIITGLAPEEHGLVLDDGVSWENPVLRWGSRIANLVLPASLRTQIGAWLLTNTGADAFRTPASYYEKHGLQTVFDGCATKAIGIPNYVVDETVPDSEHQLRQRMGDLFERDDSARGGHTTSNRAEFYELCLEMVMVRIARTRRALRSRNYELVFGYTSGLDLIGHVSHDVPAVQERAYAETDDFVGELSEDLRPDDELLLVSDHGLQNGLHTNEAMVASTDPGLVERINSVTDVYDAVRSELSDEAHKHASTGTESVSQWDEASDERVQQQLEDLGYF